MLKYISFAEDLMIHSVLRRVILDALSWEVLDVRVRERQDQRKRPANMSGTCIIYWTLFWIHQGLSRNIKQSWRKHWNTQEHEKTFPSTLQFCHRPKTGEEPSRKEAQKKVIPWLRSFGMQEIKTPRGFQKSQRQYYLCLIKWIKRQEKFGEIAGQ